MANWDILKQSISNVIKQNGNNDITGALMQSTLLSIINNMGQYGTFAGIATPGTNPGNPDQNIFYLAFAPGVYTNFGAIEIPPNTISIFTKQTGVWTALINQLQTVKIGSYSVLDKNYILANTAVASNGNLTTNATQYPGYYSIADQPFDVGFYNFSGYTISAQRYFALANSSGVVKPGSVTNMGAASINFEVQNDGYNRVRALVKTPIDTDENWQSKLSIAKGTTPKSPHVTQINDTYIEAKYLAPDNITPTPQNPMNAVNLAYFLANALSVLDMEVTVSKNLAKNFIHDKYIVNTGTIATGVGWVMCEITGLNPGDVFTIGDFSITIAGYAAFFNDNTLVSYAGSYGTGTLPKTFVWANGANRFLFDVARPTDTADKWAQTMANLGSELLPYENPNGKLKSLKGAIVDGGGGTSDVKSFKDLNDVPTYTGNGGKGLKIKEDETGVGIFDPVEQGDNVEFGTVEAYAIIINNMPVWDETGVAPIEVGDDYNYPDGNGNFYRKTRGV